MYQSELELHCTMNQEVAQVPNQLPEEDLDEQALLNASSNMNTPNTNERRGAAMQ